MSPLSMLTSFTKLGMKLLIVASVVIGFQSPVAAQLTSSDEFIKAVKDREGSEATRYIDQGFINTKQRITGLTALHIVVDRRDTQWLTFLLQKKAKPDVKDRDGVSPLMRAVELNFIEGVEKLLQYDADVDYTNRSGETPLIKAVNLGYAPLVRILLDAGADPDRNDIIQGFSAREYATRNPRASRILAIIEAKDEEKKKAANGTAQDDSEEADTSLDLSGFAEPAEE